MSAFGGDVLRHIMLYDKTRIYGRIYVVSAYSGGVTNQLLEHKKSGEPGIYALFAGGEDYHGALNGLAASLKKLNAGFATWGCRWRWPMHSWICASARPRNTWRQCTTCWPAVI